MAARCCVNRFTDTLRHSCYMPSSAQKVAAKHRHVWLILRHYQLTVAFCLQVVKNKCAPPYKIAEFDIMFGSGISGLGCLLDAAEGVDIVQKKGSWYSFGDQKLGQGRDKTMAILAENTEMQRQACTLYL